MKKNYHKTRPRPLNYGWIMKHGWNYRKALRQCRMNKKRYGAAFDETEVKELFTCPGPLFPEEYFDGVFWYMDPKYGGFLTPGKIYMVTQGAETFYLVCEGSLNSNGAGHLKIEKNIQDSTGGPSTVFQYAEFWNDGKCTEACCLSYESCSVSGEVEVTKTIDPKYLPEGGVGYIEKKTVEVFPKQTLEFGELSTNWYAKTLSAPLSMNVDEEYTVIFDGVEYKDTYHKGSMVNFIGDKVLAEGTGGTPGDIPFAYGAYEGEGPWYFAASTPGTHTIEIYTEVGVIVPIDQKFIVLTSPNGKKFNLSVDDNGTITAIEI